MFSNAALWNQPKSELMTMTPLSLTSSYLTLQLESDFEGDLLVARIDGRRQENDADAFLEYQSILMRVADCCESVGTGKLLILVSVEQAGSTNVALRLFTDLESLGVSKSIQTAFVFPSRWNQRVNQIGVDIANKQGWRIRSFDEEQAARAWLMAPAGHHWPVDRSSSPAGAARTVRC